jgi:F-type H+-transporting ATPase subunit b
MKRLAFVAIVFLLSAKLPVRAQESEAQKVKESTGATEHGEPALIWGWANFLLLAGGLGYVIKKNAGPYFAKRSQEIRKGMMEAEAVRAESDAKVAEVDRRLANLQSEIEAMRRNAQQEAEAEHERVRREAAAEMAKIQGHLAEEIASASKAARLELRRYSAELALGLAEKKIAARMSPESQDRLVKTFIATMAQAAPAGQVR